MHSGIDLALKFKISGLQKSSLIDYPDKISAVVFTQGCNFCCGYCHNPGLLPSNSTEPSYLSTLFFEFLKKRQGKLDGVVITGGEPCLQPHLDKFIRVIRSLGFLVKLDTNGSKPEILQNLINQNLLDYVAMDIKAPLSKYSQIVGTKVDTNKIKESIDMLMENKVKYEFRTTVLKSQLGLEEFNQIAELVKGANKYYLQKFVPSEILNPVLALEKNYTDEEFGEIVSMLNNVVKFVEVR